MTDPENLNSWPWKLQVDPSEYSSGIEWPRISIVTPSYNQGEFIEETILSVLHQNYPNLEYIIVDGGSSDKTVEIIEKYSNRITYWVSEKDSGQPEAINKGIQKCTGEIFNWINSDDLLAQNALLKLAESYLRNPDVKLIAGGCISIKDNVISEYAYNKQDLTFEGIISERSNFQQPSQWIVLKNNHIQIDQTLQYSFDWDMILNMNLKEKEISYITDPVSYFRDQPKSKTNNFDIHFKEDKLQSVRNYYKKNQGNRWIILKYALLLEAYLQTFYALSKNGKLFPLLKRKPQYLLSRFFTSNLLNEIFHKKSARM